MPARARQRRGLGRGLDALLGEISSGQAQSASWPGGVRELPIDTLRRSALQPRRRFDQAGLKELAQSIRAQGLVQPLVARPVAAGAYEIVAGERRWRAAGLAGLTTVPVVVRELEDREVMCMALIENIQRQDLGALEQAEGLARLVRDFSMSHEALARVIGCSRPAVSNLLRLLDLQEGVKALLDAGRLQMGHARALLALEPGAQLRMARQVVRQDLSVRATEQLVKSAPRRGQRPRSQVDPNVRALQEQLATRLGTPVTIRAQASGRGQITIRYHSLDELDGILAKIGQAR